MQDLWDVCHDMRRAGKTFTEDEALRLFTQLMQALEVAHANGVIHCEIDPWEVFLTSENDIKIGGWEKAFIST